MSASFYDPQMMKVFYSVLLCLLSQPLWAQQVTELKRFKAPNARQAVAADSDHIYAINNSQISKRLKSDGTLVDSWEDNTGTIHHLNSAIMVDDQLYCASSNYPKVPMISSIEIFDANTMQHKGTHSFGIFAGSCTWVLWHQEHWWAFFAHYENRAQSENKGVEWSTLIKFDKAWRQVESWVLPDELVQKLRPYSLSGGIFIGNNELMVTGHHNRFIYILRLPPSGSALKFVSEIPVPVRGQGLASDPSEKDVYWGIDKDSEELISFRLNLERLR